MHTIEQVIATLGSLGIVVNADVAETLAAEASEREAQMASLWAYDLTGVDTAIEVSRRGRR